MPRGRKPKQQEPKLEAVQCPVRGHSHKLQLVPHPETPGLVVAFCGDRMVYQASENPRPAVEEKSTYPGYKVPKFD